ncbi:hypothetical protein ACHAXS_011070 [Conticribra weissflogii]
MIQMRNAPVNLQKNGTAKQVLTRPFSGRRSSVDSDANKGSFYYDPKTHIVYEIRNLDENELSSSTFTKVDHPTPIHINISRHHYLDAKIPVNAGEPSKMPVFRRRSSFDVDGQPCLNASTTRLLRSAKVEQDSAYYCHPHSSGHKFDSRAGVYDISRSTKVTKRDNKQCGNVSCSAHSHPENLGRRSKNPSSHIRHQCPHHNDYYSTSKRRHDSHQIRASDRYKMEMINNFNDAVSETAKKSSRSIEVVDRSLVEKQNYFLSGLEPSQQTESSYSSSYYSKSLWDSDTSLLAVAGDFNEENVARKSNGSKPPIPPVLFLIDEVENVVNDEYIDKSEPAQVDVATSKTRKDRRRGGFINSIRKVMHPRGNDKHHRSETTSRASNQVQEPTNKYSSSKSHNMCKKSATKKQPTSSSSSPNNRQVDSLLRTTDHRRSHRNILRHSAKSTPPNDKARCLESVSRHSTHRKMVSMEGETVKMSHKSISKPAQKVNPFAFF